MRRIFVTVCAILATALLLMPQVRADTFVTVYITDLAMAKGTITDGDMDSLKSIDLDTLNISMTGSPIELGQPEILPGSDNITIGWGSTCGSYWSCLDERIDMSDYNGSYVWTIDPASANLSVGFTEYTFPSGSVILHVWPSIIARKNSSGSPVFNVSLIDPVSGLVCTDFHPILTQSFQRFWTSYYDDCNGETFTPDIVNRLELAMTSEANVGVTVSTAIIKVWYTYGGYGIDTYFNATVTATQTPYYVNWTCNNTAYADFRVSIWNQSSASWLSLQDDACRYGAQDSFSETLPSGIFVTSGKVSIRLYNVYSYSGYSNISMDEMILVVSQSSAPGPSPPSIMNAQGIYWLVMLLLACGTLFIIAFKVKGIREKGL